MATMMFNCFVLPIVMIVGCASTQDIAVVNSSLGEIHGLRIETSFLGKTGKVNVFRGIPYAEAPVGNLRFRKSVPKTRLSQPFNATDFSPACPQDLSMMMGWVPGYPNVAEDCLTLNIYVPENTTRDQTTRYGVMVWIHGGAYVIGQSKMYSAENLTLVGNIIVVTINYRLTSLGFLSTGSSKYPGNAGQWDQQLAIKWVKEHIAEFGGDPDRITIAGESAGASSVLYHTLYPDNKGLFKRIIVESGSPLCPWAFQPEPVKYARRLAYILGCTYPDLDTAVDCLQQLDAMTMVNDSRVGTMDETVFRAEWDPSIDGELITDTPQNMFKSDTDMFRDVDCLIGMNNNDGAFVTVLAFQQYMIKQINQSFDYGIPKSFFDDFYIPMYLKEKYGHNSKVLQEWVSHIYTDWRQPENESYVREKYLEFSGDFNFFMPILSILRAHAQKPTRGNNFLYEFKLRPKFNKSPSWDVGANHGEELPFVFGFPDLMAKGMGFDHNVLESEKQTSLKMMIMWSNFVKSGDPNRPDVIPDGVTWPSYDVDAKKFLQIEADKMSTSSDLFGIRTAFWLDMVPELYQQEMNGPAPVVG